MVNERHHDFVQRYFVYEHLPPHLQPVSLVFRTAAHSMLAQPCFDGAELMAGLRKLVEAKDCAVRAAIA